MPARPADAALSGPDAGRHNMRDAGGEQAPRHPGQTADGAGPAGATTQAGAVAGAGTGQVPGPARAGPFSTSVTGAALNDTAAPPTTATRAEAVAAPQAAGAPPKEVPPPAPNLPGTSDPAFSTMFDADTPRSDDAAAGVAAPDAAATPRAEHRAAPAPQSLPHGLGPRLAETVARFPDRPVEVTLSPEELGRVRMSLSTHDGALTMSVQADRPETLDLLRRNIDQLAQDFRDLGFHDLSFSFGDRPARQSTPETQDDTGADKVPDVANDPPPLRQPGMARPDQDGGLDLRL